MTFLPSTREFHAIGSSDGVSIDSISGGVVDLSGLGLLPGIGAKARPSDS